jgi:integrase
MGRRERGTGGLIRRKGSKCWYAQISINGRVRRISTHTAIKQEAQGELRRLLTDDERGAHFKGDLNKLTYGNLRAALLHNYKERGNKSLRIDAEGEETICGLPALDDFFEFEAGKRSGVPVSKLTTEAARRFAEKRTADGVKSGTVNGSLALLRRMLHIAHEDGKVHAVPKIRLLRPGFARTGFLPREQFDKLLDKLPKHLKPLVTFLYYCGARLGEALQLEWHQVNLKAGVARLEAEQTKTSEARIVPLPDVLLAMLKDNRQEGKVFDGTNLRKSWMKACAAAGLGKLLGVDKHGNQRYSGLIVHDLRRSAIRNLVTAGVPEKVAMTISGHKTRAVFDRYHIVAEEDVLAAMQRVQGKPVSVQMGAQSKRVAQKLLKSL